jgi:hypothetical protein
MRSILITAILFLVMFVISVFIFGSLLGDVDDNFWWQGLILGLPSLLLHKRIKYLSLGRRGRIIGFIIPVILFALLAGYALYGILTNRSLLDGHQYDGMEGMLPYISGILSFVPLLIGAVLLLIPGKKNR